MSEKNNNSMIIGVIFVAACVFFLINTCNQDTNLKTNTVYPAIKEVEKQSEKVEVVQNGKSITENYNSYIVGKIKNVSNETVSVYVEHFLYDKDNNRIGATNDIISNLAAGETWQYKCIVWQDGSCWYHKTPDVINVY